MDEPGGSLDLGTSKADQQLTAMIDIQLDRKQRIRDMARRSTNVFIEHLLGWKQQPIHRMWQNKARQYRKLVQDGPTEHGKTSQFFVGKPLHMICERPMEHGALLGLTGDNGSKAIKVIANHLEYNAELHAMYPDVHLHAVNKTELTLWRPHDSAVRDPTIRAIGMQGNIYGKRWTFLCSDDITDSKTTWTPDARDSGWRTLKMEVLRRVMHWNERTNIGGRHYDTGTPFHVDDCRARLATTAGYKYFRYDADGDVPLWPEWIEADGALTGWPKERLDEVREELGELEYGRQYRCIPYSGTMQVFGPEDIEQCKINGRNQWRFWKQEARERGKYAVAYRMPDHRDDPIITGIDLGAGRDLTVLFTLSISNGRKVPLQIIAGHIEAPQIAEMIVETLRRYPNHLAFAVEDNATQKLLVQVLQDGALLRSKGLTEEQQASLVVTGHTTTQKKKLDPLIGIRAMAAEFEQNRWSIPSDKSLRTQGLIDTWTKQLLQFDPTDHPGDIAMASWVASWNLRKYANVRAGGDWEQYGVSGDD